METIGRVGSQPPGVQQPFAGYTAGRSCAWQIPGAGLADRSDLSP